MKLARQVKARRRRLAETTRAPAGQVKNSKSAMGKSKGIILIILLALLAGFYFKNDILKIYSNFDSDFQDFQKTEIGNLIIKAGKEVFTPPPLNIGGAKTQAVLTKEKIIIETNLQRQNNGLSALSENTKLNEAALAKANDMFSNQYFEHISPSGVGPAELVQSFRYEYITTGENLILGNFGSEKELVQSWMDSSGHRANILNNRYAEIGVAIIKGNYKGDTVWIGVQEFGLPLSACAEPSLSLKNEIDYYESQLDSLSFEINKKRDEINNTKRNNRDYNNLVDQYNELVRQYQALLADVKNIIAQYNSQVSAFNQCVAGK